MRSLLALSLILSPLLAPAVVGTTSRTVYAPSGAGWAGVGQMGGASAVAIGPNTVLTAAHVGAGDFLLDGKTYAMASTSVAPLVKGSAVDLRIVTLRETLPTWYAVGTSVKSGAAVTMVGFGDSGTVNAPGTGYAVAGTSEGTRRVATNKVSSLESTAGEGPTLRALLKKAGDGVLGVGDSGGGWFAGGKLVGISAFTFTTKPGLAAYGFDKKGYFGSGAVNLTDKALQAWLKAGVGSRSAAWSASPSVRPVPEPGAWAAMAVGFGVLIRRRAPRLLLDSQTR